MRLPYGRRMLIKRKCPMSSGERKQIMYKEKIKGYMEAERSCIDALIDSTDNQYDEVIETLLNCKGKVVFFGIGKSGHIGAKLAATYASTGTPSMFVHAAEARHGDFGMIESRDVVILLSHSGSTSETTTAVPALKAIGCTTIAFCKSAESELAKQCDLSITYPFEREADKLGVAPSSSTTAQLVLGDAIGLTLSELKGFTRDDFHKYHPGGALGKMLEEHK